MFQITEMLSKNPEDRPSAKEIFTTSLPLLASQFASDDYEDNEDKDETEKTHTKYVCIYWKLSKGIICLESNFPPFYREI